MTDQVIQTAFWLIVGHAIADFALQTRWMTTAKDPDSALNSVGRAIWPVALGAHGAIHGGMVALATGSVLLGSLEAVSHAAIDFGKSKGRFGFYADQGAHLFCKGVWLWLSQAGLA